ncbi:MAG TPA: D-alanyl-D-alanine carboxypeptidase/D-alanyl-D-alanine-endopeptidase [Steroidobacteraceae bacterium]|nr:D-alanyl-D-alanine carboxypeptidase/D-alanyl-D-alanine-endopeptidase [Steroidobacteraceae bacterium]
MSLFVLLALLLGAPSAPAQAQSFAALARLERSGALVSAAALDLRDDRLIASRHPDVRLTPASLTKLVTAAAVLEHWPVDRTFHTRLLSAAPLHDGALDGDLVLQGAGDPSLDDHAVWALAGELRARGITTVSGRLLVSPAPFGRIACETPDRCKALQRAVNAYGAPLAAIGVDFGTWCISVDPTEPGAPADVHGCGVPLPLSLHGTIRTAPAGARASYTIERVTGADGEDQLLLSGTVAPGESQRVYRAMSDPARGVGELLREALRQLGVRVGGALVVAPAPATGLAVLADTEGLTLHEQLGRMLRFSNNYIADVLTLDLAADVAGSAPASLASATGVLSQFLSRVLGSGSREPTEPRILLSGSGLTPENRLSARDLVGLLAHEYHDARRFPGFYGALVVPRDAPFDFLRTGSDAWLDRVALKTGTLQEPSSACGVAGYLRRADGSWLAFAALVNGAPQRPHIPHALALQAERADIDALLAP